MFSLEGKKVLLTGASGGIGQSIAKVLSNAGAIIGLSSRNETKMKDLSNNLKNKSFIFPTDLANLNEVQNLIDRVEKEMGFIDILVCNAGITKDNLSMKMELEDFKDVIDVNLTATFILNRDSAKKMMRRKYGRIINISSVVGITGNGGQANYSASKAGMIAMSKSIAQEYASRNITINCIAPGFIETPMTDILTEDQKKAILNKIPMAKFGTSDDIANATLFLASNEAKYISGQTLHVNGGMLMV